MSRERKEDLFAAEVRAGGGARLPAFEEVRPGDVISSDFVNGLLLRVARLEARVATLEARPVPEAPERQVEVVTGVEPQGGQAVGQVVTVTGFFATPATANTVFLEQTPITDFVSANSGQLSFIVPASFQVAQGKTLGVKLTIENGLGKSIRDYVLKPAAQAAADNPEISSVEFINIRTRGVIGVGGMLKATGMIVRGKSFAPKAADNQVRMELRSGRSVLRFPKSGSLRIEEKDSSATQLVVSLPTDTPDFARSVEAAQAIAVVVVARDKEASHVIKEDSGPSGPRPGRDDITSGGRPTFNPRDVLVEEETRDPFGPRPGRQPRVTEDDLRREAERRPGRFNDRVDDFRTGRGRLDF